MNSTNRGLNRVVVLVVGLLVLAAGAVGVLLGVLPAFAAQWTRSSAQVARDAPSWVGARVLGTASLAVLGVALVAAVLIVLLLVFIARQGRGRSAAALLSQSGGSSTRIDLAVPRALLEQHLSEREELVGLRISAYEVRRTPMLKITARCRRGVSPAVVAEIVDRAITDLEQIVGADVPTFVQLTGGFRSGSASRPQVA